MDEALVSVDDHLADILDRVRSLASDPQPLLESVGLPVRSPIVSERSMPVFDNSAMDGYAVAHDDVFAATEETPVTLPVIGEIHAGPTVVRRIQPGTCARIMTGAVMPAGADSVVPFEWTDAGAQKVRIDKAPMPGQHVRRAGEDVRFGDTVLEAGAVIGPREVALLAGIGVASVPVAPRPRVVVMSTGAELAEPGKPLGRDQIFDSNSYMLTALVRSMGAIAYRVSATGDDPEAFREALDDQLVRADAVITTGGVSMGTRDVVKAALRDTPGVAFRKVAMQPGKPQGFGLVGPDATPIFMLPGNPVSAYVSFQVFVAPALRRMVGRSPEQRPLFRARITADTRSVTGRRQFLRGRYESGPRGATVTPSEAGPGSHLLGGLARSNCLIVLDEHTDDVRAGAAVPVILLDREY